MPGQYSPVDRLKRDEALWDELMQRAATGRLVTPEGTTVSEESLAGLSSRAATRSVGGTESRADQPASTERAGGRMNARTEAIILKVGRPSLLCSRGTYVLPDDALDSVKRIVNDFNRAKIDAAIFRTGRVELVNVRNVPYLGTGWIIEKPDDTTAIMVTNRHIAEAFATFDGRGGYEFLLRPNGKEYKALIDFKEEYQLPDALEMPIVSVIYIAGGNEPDIAFLKVKDERLKDYSPIDPSDRPPEKNMPVGIIGYPAYDSRNDHDDVARYFGDIFDVKRFAYGDVLDISPDEPEFYHDATTLGGNSGSCVIDRDTGKALGLHFGGNYREMNYAVPIAEVLRAKAGLKSQVVVSRPEMQARGDGRLPIARYKGRDGYSPKFLGPAFKVPLPEPGKWKEDLVDTVDADSPRKKTTELRYRHFSVVMCKSRKLPLITAANIDGKKAKRMGRIDKWYIDPRLGDEFQVDNDAYSQNALDRGHMVRREDPVWGTQEIAAQANQDTFHYTNCAPQHEDLNQRDWVALEDYVLGNAKTRGLKVSVFTGPIFKRNDPDYRDKVKLPRSFWKIAVVVNDDTGKLAATGYVLCQSELIKGLTDEFAYGAFRTYQVPVALIEKESGLDLSAFTPHDPFARRRRQEGIEGTTRSLFNPITRGSDIIM